MNRKKKLLIVLGCVCTFSILGTSLVLPLFNKRSGWELLFGGSESVDVGVVGDEIPEPYLYYYPPGNCMGNGYLKTVNWSYFKQLFQNHFDYLLEYRIGSGEWQNGNEYLGIGLNWDEINNYYKINLSFTKPPSPVMDVRFTIGIDMVVLSYVNRSGKFEYWLNYSIPNSDEVYSVFFNWSDLMGIPGLVFNHGILDDLFWFRFRRDDVPSNEEQVVYVFDPILGYNKIGSASMDTSHIITGTNHTMPSDCDAEIYYGKVYIDSITPIPDNYYISMLVYDSSKALVAQSERLVAVTATDRWENFSFSSETIYASSTYAICIWADDGQNNPAHHIRIFYDTGTNNVTCTDSETYDGTPPNPWSPVEYDDTMSISAYIVYNCTEEEGCTTNCSISNLKLNTVAFGNNTHNVEDCGYHNFTLDISDCLGDIDYLNISVGGVGGVGYHNVSDGNGTYYLNITSDLDCNTNYTLYINVSCQDGTYINHSWYWFETEACCVVTVESPTPSNGTICVNHNDSYLNLSIWVNSSCDNIIDWVNISFPASSNYSNQTGESEGLFYYNITFPDDFCFRCGNNFTWYVNVSDGDGCNNDTNNSWYWFWTCNCVWQQQWMSNFSFSNTSNYLQEWYSNFSFSNTSSFIQNWYSNFSFSNTTIKVWTQNWYSNFSFSNTSAKSWIQQWYSNFSFKNISFIQNWYSNFSFSNTSNHVQNWYSNFSFSNSSKVFIQHWYSNFSFSNTSITYIIISNIYPSNNSYSIPLQPYLYATFNSTLGYIMNISWYYGSSQGNETILLDTDVNISNSTQNTLFFLASNNYGTYYWRIWANDGIHNINETFIFITEGYNTGISQRTTIGIIGVMAVFGVIGIIFFVIRRRNMEEE